MHRIHSNFRIMLRINSNCRKDFLGLPSTSSIHGVFCPEFRFRTSIQFENCSFSFGCSFGSVLGTLESDSHIHLHLINLGLKQPTLLYPKFPRLIDFWHFAKTSQIHWPSPGHLSKISSSPSRFLAMATGLCTKRKFCGREIKNQGLSFYNFY